MRSSKEAIRSGLRPGFTAIELLVVIAIIGILIGLTVPAIQRSRESGRRLRCMNNLRQIGTAMHTFQSVHGYFPPAWPSKMEKDGLSITNFYSPQLHILSFLDQDAVTHREGSTRGLARS